MHQPTGHRVPDRTANGRKGGSSGTYTETEKKKKSHMDIDALLAAPGNSRIVIWRLTTPRQSCRDTGVETSQQDKHL
jgi:hypothetical protein